MQTRGLVPWWPDRPMSTYPRLGCGFSSILSNLTLVESLFTMALLPGAAYSLAAPASLKDKTIRKPEWMKRTIPGGEKYTMIKAKLRAWTSQLNLSRFCHGHTDAKQRMP